jgi:hypothetical protein
MIYFSLYEETKKTKIPVCTLYVCGCVCVCERESPKKEHIPPLGFQIIFIYLSKLKTLTTNKN